MASETEKIAASKQRDLIPSQWQVLFSDFSKSSLASLATDLVAHETVRAYARWELEYRIAFNKADPAELPQFPPVDRSKYTARRLAEESREKELNP